MAADSRLIFVAVLLCLQFSIIQLYYLNDALFIGIIIFMLFTRLCCFFHVFSKNMWFFKSYVFSTFRAPARWNVLVIILAWISDCWCYSYYFDIFFINSFWLRHVVFSWFMWSKNVFFVHFSMFLKNYYWVVCLNLTHVEIFDQYYKFVFDMAIFCI